MCTSHYCCQSQQRNTKKWREKKKRAANVIVFLLLLIHLQFSFFSSSYSLFAILISVILAVVFFIISMKNVPFYFAVLRSLENQTSFVWKLNNNIRNIYFNCKLRVFLYANHFCFFNVLLLLLPFLSFILLFRSFFFLSRQFHKFCCFVELNSTKFPKKKTLRKFALS